MSASRLPSDPPDQPLFEAVPGPIARQRAERRVLGLPARFVFLCLGCAALGATVGLFATGSWGWGIAALLLALIFFVALTPEQSGRLATDGRAQVASTTEVWRTRLETSVARWRTQSRLDQLELDRVPLLQALGEAVHRGDEAAEQQARQRLDELDERRRQVEVAQDERLREAGEKIRLARLPVQETQVGASGEPPSASRD